MSVQRKLNTGMLALTLLLCGGNAWAQSEQSQLIQRLAQRNPALLSQMAAGSLDPSSLSSLPQATPPASPPDDSSSEKQDSTSPTVEIRESVYEQLFRGETIDPDSIISELTVFGQEVFQRRSNVQASTAAQFSVPASYPVGPGDELVIMLWGRLNEEHRLSVDRNGSLRVPHIGPVTVAGLPFSVMQRTIVQRLEAIEGVKAGVTLGQLRSIQVYVMGEVNSPGLHTLSALSNVTTALFAAGGTTPMGSLRHIELRRYGKRIRSIDFYDFLLNGVESGRKRLLPGDVIFVPVAKRMVAVAGNVRRSAIYEISPDDKLPDVLDLAGGISPGAWINRIQIERMSENTYQTVLDINAPSVDSIPEHAIEDGDIIKVFPVVNRDENVVFLEGNVKRPGKYALGDTMRLSDILSDYDMLLPETYFQYAVIERFDPPSYLARIMPFSLRGVFESPHSDADIRLHSRDRILIYHRDYFEPDRSIDIDGAVTTPGKYKLLENMHVRDLILQAGGLRENASMFRGELYRRNMDTDSVTTTKIDFNIQEAMNDDPAHNILLHRFDRVFIRQKRGWQEQIAVTLSGEFRYPGTYVAFKGETLEELIERAGGYTDEAYLSAAIMTRPSVKQLEKKRLEDYAQRLERDIVQAGAIVAAEQSDGGIETMLNQQLELLRELRATEPVGRVVLDLHNPESSKAFLLENGDMLHIPRTQQTVTVIGEVYNPATFKIIGTRKQVRDYVELSGGLKPMGRKKDIYVIRANGSVVSRQMTRVMRYRLMPGDVVVVPQRVSYGARYRRFSNTLDTVLKLTTISQQASSTILGLKLATE